MFEALTETEAVTFNILLESAAHHNATLPLVQWTPVRAEISAEIGNVQGQLAYDLAYMADHPSHVLMDEIFAPFPEDSDQS